MNKFTFGDTHWGISLTLGLKGCNIAWKGHWTYLVWLPAWSISPPQSCHQIQFTGENLQWNTDGWTVFSSPCPNRLSQLSALTKLTLLTSGVITVNPSPCGSPKNWMEREGKFSERSDVGNLMNPILTRLGAELSWIPEGNKKDFIQWNASLECILQLCSSSCFLYPSLFPFWFFSSHIYHLLW